jgi:hypothetical protein
MRLINKKTWSGPYTEFVTSSVKKWRSPSIELRIDNLYGESSSDRPEEPFTCGVAWGVTAFKRLDSGVNRLSVVEEKKVG